MRSSFVRQRRPCLTPLLFGLIGILGLGCVPQPTPPPELAPVTGVLLSKTGEPVSTGSIEFSSPDASTLLASSELKEGGKFELATFTIDGQRHPGAQPGDYLVKYYPVLSEKQTEQPVELRGLTKISPAGGERKLQLPK